jgi:hypothetical protein
MAASPYKVAWLTVLAFAVTVSPCIAGPMLKQNITSKSQPNAVQFNDARVSGGPRIGLVGAGSSMAISSKSQSEADPRRSPDKNSVHP